MAGGFNKGKDSIEISELAALNDDISDDFIEQLHQQLTDDLSHQESNAFIHINPDDDSTLFEDPVQQNDSQETVSADTTNSSVEIPPPVAPVKETPNEESQSTGSFEDAFIRKYKAKLNQKNNPKEYNQEQPAKETAEKPTPPPTSAPAPVAGTGEPIEQLSNGNISEKYTTPEQKDYNSSLDFLDSNVKYSKYVIYINPENVNFIESLTVKERKNLINNILRQQDDIALTKYRFKKIRTIFIHVMIALIIFSVSIPLIYQLINSSLEATIDNHRRSQSNWQTLYKQYGKIQKN